MSDPDRRQMLTVRRYDLECWAREMRSAEMYLREYFITQDPPTSVEDPHSFSHPDCICGPESPAEHWSTCPCRRQS